MGKIPPSSGTANESRGRIAVYCSIRNAEETIIERIKEFLCNGFDENGFIISRRYQ